MLTRTARLEANPQLMPVQAIGLPAIAYVMVLGVAIFAHWPALLTDSVMWDDWLILSWITQGRLDWLYQFFNNYGVTPLGLVYLPFFAVTPTMSTAVEIVKFVDVMSVALNAVLVLLISVRVAHGNRVFAIVAGMAAAVFPGMSGEGLQLTFLIYAFFVPLFLTGILLFVETARATRFPFKLLLRVAALAALFLSFSLNSLLVFFYALVPAVFYASLGRAPAQLRPLLADAVRFLARHVDFMALPIVFWVLKEHLMPRYGIYTRYNVLHFDPVGLVVGYVRFIPDILRMVVGIPLSIPLAALGAAAVLVVVFRKAETILRRVKDGPDGERPEFAMLLGLGCLALIGAAFPYYLVGRRSFQAFGYMARDTVLFPLGIGWVSAALFCAPLQSLWPRRATSPERRLRMQRAVVAVSCALLCAQSLANWRSHADWQAHYAYYRSVVGKVAHDDNVVAASVIELVDQLPGDRTMKYWKYPTSIWTAILSEAFHQTTRLVIPYPPANGKAYTPDEIKQRFLDTQVEFMLGGIDLKGPQVQLRVAPASNSEAWNPVVLALAYWRARFLVPDEMPKLLESLTEVRSIPVTRPGANP